jgi:signal transduction histidine kinase/ActR/RegA family two-component response regulator
MIRTTLGSLIRTKIAAFLIVTAAVFSVALAIALQFYLRAVAREMLDSWLQSQAVAIQEGNLLSSLSNSRRVVLSSQFVRSVGLLDDQLGSSSVESLAHFGVDEGSVVSRGPASAGVIEIADRGVFHVEASYRFAETKNLFVRFVLKPQIFVWSYIGLNVVLLSMVLLSVATVFVFARREALSRLAVIKASIDELVTRDNPTESLASECPGLAATWKEMKNQIQDLSKRIEKQSRTAAIAQMTQMFAHDVRKPFSSIKIVLSAFENMKSIEDVQAMTELAIPEINRSIETVNGLIQDVMEIGSTSKPMLEDVDPLRLIERVLIDNFRIYPNSDVRIHFSLGHSGCFRADQSKCLRLLSNIVGNGLQAMNFSGTMTFKTRDVFHDRPFIEMTIANDGPHIPAESLPNLFEAFYTSGKKGGVGLGLAIVQKIVSDHGGRIRCISEPNRGVAFVFTLPATIRQRDVLAEVEQLPMHSSGYMKVKIKPFEANAFTSADVDDSKLLAFFGAGATGLGRKLRVLIADDERLYRDGIIEKIRQHDAVHQHVQIETASNPQDAIAHVDADLSIVDVDFGSQAMNGFNIVSNLRRMKNRGIICTHSNRILTSDHKTAIEHGADAFLPKPMSLTHLLKLLCQAVERAETVAELR